MRSKDRIISKNKRMHTKSLKLIYTRNKNKQKIGIFRLRNWYLIAKVYKILSKAYKKDCINLNLKIKNIHKLLLKR